jgi:signal transduction histidine kinase
VVGDRVRLEQVAANLVDNAVKYTPAGGRVTITASRDADGARVTVSDSGPGIPAADLPHVWERLFRGDASRSARGLGLGLSLVKAIVEAHGGSVAVQSPPGQGAAFSVVLPVQPT